MLVSCPNCATNFSLPDQALRPAGRRLKCARCGHKWFQSADADGQDLGLDESSFPPPPRASSEMRSAFREPEPVFDDPAPEPAPVADDAPLDLDLDEPPLPDFGPKPKAEVPPPDIDLDPDSEQQPIPAIFTDQPTGGRKGTAALWVLLAVLVLGGLGGGVYYFQDKVVGLWPGAHDVLNAVGLRHERPGVGLELRSAGTPERFVQNDTEALMVRGIIANISDRERSVPTMKLVLLDRDKAVVQEKQAPPPVASLDPGATAGFRIIVERPDPNAVEVNVLFVDPRDGK